MAQEGEVVPHDGACPDQVLGHEDVLGGDADYRYDYTDYALSGGLEDPGDHAGEDIAEEIEVFVELDLDEVGEGEVD